MSGALLPTSLGEALEVAKLIAYSGMVPKDYIERPGAVLVAIQMGAEVGLSPLASVQNIAVINGRPSIWGDAMLALALNHPDVVDVLEDDLKEITANGFATCTVVLRERENITRTFSIADAEKAKLLNKDTPWRTYTNRMLQMRARGFALRDSVPGAFRGLHQAEVARELPPIVLVASEALTPAPEPEQEPEQNAKTTATTKALEERREAKAKAKAKAKAPAETAAKGKAKGRPKPTKKPETEAEPEQGEFDDIGPPAMTDEESAEARDRSTAEEGAGF